MNVFGPVSVTEFPNTELSVTDWVNPPATLSEEMLAGLEESREQAERGETVSAEEARERLGLDD